MVNASENFVAPRVIIGNRGDLVSRYGILSFLKSLGCSAGTVFANSVRDVEGLELKLVRYNGFHNVIPRLDGIRAIARSKYILWTAGLDIQDEASHLKNLYLLMTFTLYNMLGKKIILLCQGAGPLKSFFGRWLARAILNLVDVFVARDPRTYSLLQSLGSRAELILAQDGIFCGEISSSTVPVSEKQYVDHILRATSEPVIGFNIRLWFHFKPSLIPYAFSKKKSTVRAQDRMSEVIRASAELIRHIRKTYGARVVLISAYQPGEMAWEDDQPWLQQVKERLAEDDDVILIEQPLSLSGYCYLISRLQLVIGSRLHTTLTSLRLGVPAINLNYTLKGRDIFDHLGLGRYVEELTTFMADPSSIYHMIDDILNNHVERTTAVINKVQNAKRENEAILKDVFQRHNLAP